MMLSTACPNCGHNAVADRNQEPEVQYAELPDGSLEMKAFYALVPLGNDGQPNGNRPLRVSVRRCNSCGFIQLFDAGTIDEWARTFAYNQRKEAEQQE